MITCLFDDHYEAFPLWREAGLRDLTCLHVDAHLDVMAEGFTAETLRGIGEARTRSELARFRGDPKLPWGGFHCGNYLYPALMDGTVTTLIWLLPRHILKGPSFLDGVRMELANWVDLTFAEDRALREVDGRVEGELLGRRFVVCTSESIPALSDGERANLALDIDVDYFVRLSDDKVWQTPHQLRDALGYLEPVALTVALSCDGGYTPFSERYLGQVCVDLFSGDVEASRLASDYVENPLNLAARCLQKGQLEQGLEILSRCDDPDGTRVFLSAMLGAGLGSLSGSQLESLLNRPELGDFERARLWRKQAEIWAEEGQGRRAVAALKKTLKVEPERAETHFRLATLQRQAGERDAAARSLRKALKLVQGRVSSLPMLLESWRLYQQMGQSALARATLKELLDNDTSGVYAAQVLLEQGRARRA